MLEKNDWSRCTARQGNVVEFKQYRTKEYGERNKKGRNKKGLCWRYIPTTASGQLYSLACWSALQASTKYSLVDYAFLGHESTESSTHWFPHILPIHLNQAICRESSIRKCSMFASLFGSTIESHPYLLWMEQFVSERFNQWQHRTALSICLQSSGGAAWVRAPSPASPLPASFTSCIWNGTCCSQL